jgi:pimeloyl-ACP methyl ester carboxylesterase
MGGKVAMTLAARYPQLISRLLVADIAPVAYRHDYDDLIEPILALDLSRYASRTEIDHALRSHITEDPLRAFLLHNLLRSDDGWKWRVNWRVIQQDMDALTGFDSFTDDWVGDLPTLFIRGANSDYVGSAEVEVIERHFSNASVATIEAAGHWLHAEKPEEFSALALRFLLED